VAYSLAVPAPRSPRNAIQLATIARRYFLDQRTKVEIAEEFQLSRFKVARLLREAIDSGVVQIEVRSPADIDIELSEALRRSAGLHDVLVVPTRDDADELRVALGATAAAFLGDLLVEGDVVGMSWGRTLNAMTAALPPLPRVDIVQLTGAVGGNLFDSPVEIVRRAALNAGGEAHPIFAPLVVDNADTAAALRRQPDVARAMRLFDRITKAVVAVGSWDPPGSQLREAMRPAERAALLARGVRAEVCATFVSDDGRLVADDYVERCIAISAAQLRAVPEVVAVAGGASKARAIGAVLRAGLVTSLVTDSDVATHLLDSGVRRPDPA